MKNLKKSKKRIKVDIPDENSITISCTICGEPLDHSNEFGMYCTNECGIDEDKKAKEKIEKIFNKFQKLLGGIEDK